MILNPSLIINSVPSINKNPLVVNCWYYQESLDHVSTLNVVIAAFAMAQNRIYVSSYLVSLGENVWFSSIFKYNDEAPVHIEFFEFFFLCFRFCYLHLQTWITRPSYVLMTWLINCKILVWEVTKLVSGGLKIIYLEYFQQI